MPGLHLRKVETFHGDSQPEWVRTDTLPTGGVPPVGNRVGAKLRLVYGIASGWCHACPTPQKKLTILNYCWKEIVIASRFHLPHFKLQSSNYISYVSQYTARPTSYTQEFALPSYQGVASFILAPVRRSFTEVARLHAKRRVRWVEIYTDNS